MSLMIESMGVVEQVSTMARIAQTLGVVVKRHNSRLDQDVALAQAAEEAEVPISQMRYVLAYALTEGVVKQDRAAGVLTA